MKVLNPNDVLNEAVATGPKCPKCGGSTVPVLIASSDGTRRPDRKCLECEVELVQPEGKPPYLKPRV